MIFAKPMLPIFESQLDKTVISRESQLKPTISDAPGLGILASIVIENPRISLQKISDFSISSVKIVVLETGNVKFCFILKINHEHFDPPNTQN